MDEVLRELEVLEDNLQFNAVLLGESTCTCTVSTMFVMAVKIDREKRLVMQNVHVHCRQGTSKTCRELERLEALYVQCST